VGDKELYDIEKEMSLIPTIRYRFKLSQFKMMATYNLQILRDIQGFVFYTASDQYISIIFATILQMPELNNVFARETANKMYSPSAFYIARWFASTILYAFQPFIYTVMAFCFIGFKDSSFENF